MNAAVVPEKDAVASKQSSEEEEQKATTEKVAEEEEYVERIDGEEEVSWHMHWKRLNQTKYFALPVAFPS